MNLVWFAARLLLTLATIFGAIVLATWIIVGIVRAFYAIFGKVD